MTYATTHDDRERERIARTMTTCPTCGRPKTVGAVVCWGACWAGPDGLKRAVAPAGVWLACQPRLWLIEEPADGPVAGRHTAECQDANDRSARELCICPGGPDA